MVGGKREIIGSLGGYREISLLAAIGRVIIGMAILIGVLIILDIFVYLGVTGGIYGKEVKAAYDDSYTEAYTRSYKVGYEQAHEVAYHQGYIRGRQTGTAGGVEGHTGSIVELRIPWYKEMKDFLAADTTDSNEYISEVYTCFDYAAELNNNAEASGIRAAYVSIRASGWAHALVAFETMDRGLFFIEPQSDREVDVVIGESYPWWMSGASRPMNSGDAIEEIRIIW